MRTTIIMVGVFAVMASVPLVGGCVIDQSASGAPTYEADVKPIVLSRCGRCHGIPPMGEPKIGMPTSALDRYDDTGNCAMMDGGSVDPSCVRGAKYYAKTMSAYIHFADGDTGRMPPPPSPRLSQYQLDTIDRWSAQTPPPP
jgi:hypothetical protein